MDIKSEILYRAEKTMFYNDLLVNQCDGWLSEDEGMKNMKKKIRKKEKREKKKKFQKIIKSIINFDLRINNE